MMKIFSRCSDLTSLYSKIGVYYLYKDNKIVYIGSSVRIGKRIRAHKRGKYSKGGCYKKFDSFAFIELHENELLVKEAIEIFTHAPLYNMALPICKFNSNDEFLNRKELLNG